jgi:cardiolipin synthase
VNHITPPAAKWYGKFATVVFYFSVVTIIFLKAAFNYESDVLVIVLFVLTAAVMVFALVKYAILFFGLLKEAKNK